MPVAGRGALWLDSVTLMSFTRTGNVRGIELLDVRDGSVRNAFDVPDTLAIGYGALHDGWVWMPKSMDRLILREGGKQREVKVDAFKGELWWLISDEAHRRVFAPGRAFASDSVRVLAISLDDGRVTPWFVSAADGVSVSLDGAGGIRVDAMRGERLEIYAVTAPMVAKRIGAIPLPVSGFSASRDLKRATVTVRDYRADAWMSQVVIK